MLLQSQHNPGIQQLFAWINREVFGHLKHGLSGADSEESSMVSAETRARNQEMMSMFGMAVDMGDAVPPASAPSPSPLPSSSAPLNPARICSLPPSSMITPPSVLPPASHVRSTPSDVSIHLADIVPSSSQPSSSFASQDTASLTAAATATFAEDTESTSTSRNPQASSVQPFHQEHMNDTTLTTTINPTGPAQTKLAKRGKGKSAVTKRPTRVSPRNRVATE
ncbi:hypothetical protein BDY19DRAFT_583937 [Irpex rosettiformis]|uniref:Uncharacterized protein n=1 Tax=Irpex rosettiformis TaxID=378272 RepID=A0ACB8UCW0_9APHY|nr:hypothetical protein BDY19DRAFT_583937 [Irpex rosettiformis]